MTPDKEQFIAAFHDDLGMEKPFRYAHLLEQDGGWRALHEQLEADEERLRMAVASFDRMRPAGRHVPEESLALLLDGALPDTQREKALKHLATCRSCRDQLFALHRVQTAARSNAATFAFINALNGPEQVRETGRDADVLRTAAGWRRGRP